MQNLRIKNVNVSSSSVIEVSFTHTLTPNLITANVTITSETPNVPSSEVLGVSVNSDILTIKCQPLTTQAAYFLQFQSTTDYKFTSLNGDAILLEDGVSNKYLIIGPMDPDNPVKNYLKNFLRDNLYDIDNSTSTIAKYIDSIATIFSKALYDVGQLKNDNYLSRNIVDERKIRGEGPFDRLDEEGAYEVMRVGKTPTSTKVGATFNISEFPSFPITLQKQSYIETLYPDSSNDIGKFNINSLIFNLTKNPVTKVTYIKFTFENAHPVYIYNIEELGYQIKDSRYDQDYSYRYVLLNDNQIKISDSVINDSLFYIDQIFKVDITYEYKDLGRYIDESSVNVYTVLNSTREVIPPIINVFALKHAPITDSNGTTLSFGGVLFIDPNSIAGLKHPAFLSEIEFRLNALPISPGQYSIDYSTGTVYVYGATSSNDGTGPYPPLATYKYKYTYQSQLDYVYDPDLLDIVALPKGSLINYQGNINFNYEIVLVPGVDYNSSLHKEELSERIENRLVALNAVRAANTPITNVFRVYNETSGEIYQLDRWYNDLIYYRYTNPPRINEENRERVSFENITNELLFVNTTITNINSLRIFKIYLDNNSLIAESEDSYASSFNSSLVLSNEVIFNTELYFDREVDVSVNIDKLSDVGEFIVDYQNGVIYCAVLTTQSYDIGTTSYKINKIVTNNKHLITVNDIYYQIDALGVKNKEFAYISFTDSTITPDILDYSDELYLNSSDTYNVIKSPYIYNEGRIGIILDSFFIPGVTYQVKSVRSVYEHQDLLQSNSPTNFAPYCTFSGSIIKVNSLSKNSFGRVGYDSVNYFVDINENLPILSSNITYVFSVVRPSTSEQLFGGIIVPGNPVRLILNQNSPIFNEPVNISYQFSINDVSRVVVDYNKGDLFVDYTFLFDEIIISYEYGDNVIDFRTNKSVSPNTEYYVTYKAGALRDALYKNFGNLINIPELTTFDIDFDRERYRDALMAGLSSFIQGPTVGAIKNIGKLISHIEPEIIESIFQNWSLGNSLLNPTEIVTEGEFQLLPAKFNNGALVDNNQTIKFPVSSNIRLEEGTFESWIIPQWDGLDNNADLIIKVLKDNQPLPVELIFIGVSEQHPSSNEFKLNKYLADTGTPNKNKNGIFFYYDNSFFGKFNRFFVNIIDDNIGNSTYDILISTNGGFYDVISGSNYDGNSLLPPTPSNMIVRTSKNNLKLIIKGGGSVQEGISFLSDVDHYLLDFAQEENKNRLSIYKDISGYFNFRIFDKNKTSYNISHDVSDWKSGVAHHVAASWKINTMNNRDELHLFIDGFEVPNIIKFGQNRSLYLHEKFRSIDTEQIVGFATKDIVGSDDLKIIQGSTVVESSINFSSFNINPGDFIYIDEVGFSPDGYQISIVNGQKLTLISPMPRSLTNARFSVNRLNLIIESAIDTAPNIAVSTMHSVLSGSDLVGWIGENKIYSPSINFNLIKPGFIVKIDNPYINSVFTITKSEGSYLYISENLDSDFSNSNFYIYSEEQEIPGTRALRPSYSISKDGYYNNILTLSNNIKTNDIILVRTLGLNSRKIKKQYYVWSNQDGYVQENILRTNLPPPISLDEVKINKIIFPLTSIGPLNSVIVGSQFVFNMRTDPVTRSDVGRSVQATISGNNIDFSTPVQIVVRGTKCGSIVGTTQVVFETLSFTSNTTLDFINSFINIDHIMVTVTPLNILKPAMSVEIRERYSMTNKEDNVLYPVIKYSYSINSGYNLYNDGYGMVTDGYKIFSDFCVGCYLFIGYPAEVAGYYKINAISQNRKSLYITSTVPAYHLPLSPFTDGVYQILYTTSYRSGLQNGFFTFENDSLHGQEYFLTKGFYELNYESYINVDLMPPKYAFLGNSYLGNSNIYSILDQVKIYSVMLTDTRIGEFIPSNQTSITKDFNSLKALKSDKNTLMLINFDEFPFTNNASFYSILTDVNHLFTSSIVVNENFETSLAILDHPLIISNDGILDNKKQGTIEFWISPFYDAANDPSKRYYFDAFGAKFEEVTSVSNVAIKLSHSIKKVISVRLKNANSDIDYFAGGRLEIDTQNAIVELHSSGPNNSVSVNSQVLQVISVKIVDDYSNVDYFDNGSISSDRRTLYLGKTLPRPNLNLVVIYKSTYNNSLNTQVIRLNKKLPYQNSRVIVEYIPEGFQGDRISIFKDQTGEINFGISASGYDYVISAPVRWARNTWHRIKASYKINSGSSTDELRLFIDGYEYKNLTYGNNLLYGKCPEIYGYSIVGDGYTSVGSINFKDSINQIFVGSEFTGESPMFGLIDNLRISNISRPLYSPYGESIDLNYSSNMGVNFPVTSDLYTTYLLDFNQSIVLNEDFAELKNTENGLFDFSVNIFDSFGIVSSSIKVKNVLEKLIKILKPANSKCFIQYF